MGLIDRTDASSGFANPASARFVDVETWRGLVSADDMAAAHRAWLTLFCAQLDLLLAPQTRRPTVVVGAVLALGTPDGNQYARAARYGVTEEDSVVLTKVAERTLATRRAIVQAGDTATSPCHVTQPLIFADKLWGVVAVELRQEAKPHLEIAIRAAQWSVAWFGWRFRAPDPQPIDATEAARALEIARATARGPSVASGGEAVATRLAEDLGADRVSIGQVRGNGVRILAAAHGGLGSGTTHFLRALTAAMNEAADAGAPIAVPARAGEETPAVRSAHVHLLRQHEADWAVSVPWQWGEPEAPPVDLVWTATGRGTPPDDLLDRMTRAVDLAAPMLAGRLDETRSPRARRLAALVRHRHRWAVGLTAAAMAIVAVSLVPIDNVVIGDATLEGSLRRVVVAPFDGYLVAATARPGDRVEEGGKLVALDDRELKLQKIDLESRIVEVSKQIDEALGRDDASKVGVLTARRDQVHAQLQQVDDGLGRSVLTAPFAGYVVSGDRTQAIGSPVRRGDVLYEISPLDGFRVAISVPQADFAHVEVGQTGRLVLSSLPFESFGFTVERLAPVATSGDGKTVFRVEARLEGAGDHLRPGMQGIAHVTTAPRSIAWVYGHGIVEWLRLKTWEYVP